MTVYNLEYLFAPRTLAMVGHFAEPSSKEGSILKNLCASRCESLDVFDLDGQGRAEGYAERASWHRGLEDVGHSVDVLVAALSVREVAGIIDECARLRVKNIVLTRRRMRGEDEEYEEEIRRKARSAGIRLLGLNSSGLIVPGVQLNTFSFEADPADGRIALLSQSGSIASSILDRAQERKIGFSHVVSLGSLLDIDFGDAIDYLVWEQNVRCVLLSIENLVAVKKFLSACRAAARAKPIVAIKGGRSALGGEIIAKHTGKPAGEDKVYDTAFRRAGIIRVETIGELLSSGEALARKGVPKGERLGIITNSGGIGVLIADSLSLKGLPIPQLSPELRAQLERYAAPYSGSLNPLCLGGDVDASRYVEVIDAYLRSGEFHAVMVVMVLGGAFSPRAVAERVRHRAASANVDLVYVWLGNRSEHEESARRLAEQGDTIYYSVEEATTAYAYSVRYRDMLSKIVVVPPRFDHALAYRQREAREHVSKLLEGDREAPKEHEAGELLELYGIPVDPMPRGEVEYELKAGVRTDLEFGPYLFLGVGGRMARVVREESVILPPLNRLLAGRLIEKSGLAERLDLSSEAVENLEEIIVRISQLVVDFPEIYDLEVNPLALAEEGFIACRARLRLRDRGLRSPDHLATAPYPNQYEFVERLRDGRSVQVRPIRPEDAASHYEFVRSLSSQTLYNRFFGVRRQLSDQEMVRFTQIDYDREIAIIATVEDEGREVTIGVNRVSYDPHEATYEFSVVVADAWQGTGVGAILMEKLLYIARDRGIRSIYGLVLPGNRKMLGLATRFGFTVAEHDADTVTIRVDLS
jgi:acetyltransferase